MGSAALHHLALRGLRAIGIERATPGHEGSSSHGDSRAIRLAYFEHPSYVPLLRRAYDNWRDLERRTGERLLQVTGVLEAGPGGCALLEGSIRSCLEHELPHEQLTARQVAERFPAFDLPADWEAVIQPDGGFLRPERAIQAHLKIALARGAETRLGQVVVGVEPRQGDLQMSLDRPFGPEEAAVGLDHRLPVRREVKGGEPLRNLAGRKLLVREFVFQAGPDRSLQERASPGAGLQHAGDLEQALARAPLQVAPVVVGPPQQRHVGGMFEIGQADGAAVAVGG